MPWYTHRVCHAYTHPDALCICLPVRSWVHHGTAGSKGSRGVSTAEVLGHGPRADPVLIAQDSI